jgi:hypothetical protein
MRAFAQVPSLFCVECEQTSPATLQHGFSLEHGSPTNGQSRQCPTVVSFMRTIGLRVVTHLNCPQHAVLATPPHSFL